MGNVEYVMRREEHYGDGNERTWMNEERKTYKRRWLDKVKEVIKGKGLSGKEVYDRVTWRRRPPMSSHIDPT